MEHQERKTVIAVIGMHRSGTSALTRGLQVMGIALGENLIEAAEGINPKGFWEDADLNELNRDMLAALGKDWHGLTGIGSEDVARLAGLGFVERAGELLDEKTSKSSTFGFKDPRVAKLFPFWYPVLRRSGFDVHYVYVLRNPLSVVQSLVKRDRMDPGRAYYLWLGYVIPPLRGLMNEPLWMVDYDRLITEPSAELGGMAETFGYQLDPGELEVYQNEFLDPTLRHASFDAEDLENDPACPALVREVYADLFRVASHEAPLREVVTEQKLESWEQELIRLEPSFRLVDDLYLRLAASAERGRIMGDLLAVRLSMIGVLEHDLGERERIIRELLNSKSWKVTRPLRSLLRRMRGSAGSGDDALEFLTDVKPGPSPAALSLSFVVVRFSGDYEHNFAVSRCVSDPHNDVVVVENVGNLNFSHLGEALNYGLEQAVHDIVVVLHEDVFLHPNWQRDLGLALRDLNEVDPDWAILGCAGLSADDRVLGHYEDPHGYVNTFGPGQRFQLARSLDEHLLILRKSRRWRFDPDLPGIHGLGSDLILSAAEDGRDAYVVNAKSWHKYRDEHGRPILFSADSGKIRSRTSLAYLADKQCCDDYMSRKWSHHVPFRSNATRYGAFRSPEEQLDRVAGVSADLLDQPIVFLGMGATDAALLQCLARDFGINVGLIPTGAEESIEMAQGVYQALLEKFKCTADWQRMLAPSRLRLSAARLVQNLDRSEGPWGFVSSAGSFLMPELAEAFPRAKFVIVSHELSDPLTAPPLDLASIGNEVGRAMLPAAYDRFGRKRQWILSDSDATRATCLNAFHDAAVREFLGSEVTRSMAHRVEFAACLKDPAHVLLRFADWLGCSSEGARFRGLVARMQARGRISLTPDDLPDEIRRCKA
jgi:hypothetical protein